MTTMRHCAWLSLVLVVGPAAAEDRPAAQRPRRLIYNSDADNMFIYVKPPMRTADVHKYVDEIADAGATTLLMSPNYGQATNFPTKVGDFVVDLATPQQLKKLQELAATKSGSVERATANFKALVDAGHDPLGLVIERARQRKLEVFITFRLNEVHCLDTPDEFPLSLLIARWWRKNPQWHIDKVGGKLSPVHREIMGPNTSPVVSTWLPAGLNFALPEVRKFRLAELRECCERYPIDGLDLDFQRFPMFFKIGDEPANLPTMTEWVRQVRELTRQIGRKRGRPMLLSARVMARPEQNRQIGLDVQSWVKEGLLDFLTVSHYLRNDFALPIGDYRKLVGQTMPLYGSIEVEPTAAKYRSIARQLWRDGVDGISLFNFFTCRENGVEPQFGLVRELGDPAKAAAKNP